MMRCVMQDSIVIRRGTLQDLTAIQAFTQNTFSWGDYLPRVWAQWVDSGRGDLLVAECGCRVVGTVHVQYLEQREAWLEGVRVHPDFRRQNIATILIESAHAHAHGKRCRTMRLETGAHNIAGQRTFEKLGYRRVNEYAVYQADASSQEWKRIRAAKISDVEACNAIWQASWAQRVSHNLVPSEFGWRWWEWNAARLRRAIRAKNVWVMPDTTAPKAFMITRIDDSVDVILLAGQKRAAVHLLNAARGLAKGKSFLHSYWLVSSGPRPNQWASAAGYALEDSGMLIYERNV